MASNYDGSLKFDTRINEKGFNSGVKNLTGRMSGLIKSIKAVGTAIAGAFVVKAIKSTIDAAEELQNAMTGLKSVMDGQGRSFNRAQQFINQYTEDGLIPANNAITAYKNLALRGYNTDQIEKVMTALKDSATYGRQSAYTLGEAVQSASEGLKNENSILVDNAGVTKNVAKMWEEYAKSIGKTRNQLTQQEKIQAEVNGILKETRFQTGDAAIYTNTYSGQVARLNQQWLTLKQTLGGAFMTLAQAIIPTLNKIMSALIKLAQIFSAVITTLFGKFVKTAEKTSKTTKKAAAGISGMGDAAEQAGKQAQEALLPFDDLNVLQEDTASGSGSGVSIGGVDTSELDNLDLATPEIDTSGIERWAKIFKEKVKEVKDFIEENKEIITSLLVGITLGLGTFFTILNFSKIVASIGPLIKAFGTLKAGISVLFLGMKEGAGLFTTLSTIFGSVGATAAIVAVAVAAVAAALVYLYQTSEPFRELVQSAFSNLIDILTNFYNSVLIPIFNLLKDIFSTVIVPLISLLAEVFVGVVDVVFSVLLSLWNNILAPIANFLVDVLGMALQAVIEIWEAWKPTIEKIFTALKWIWDELLSPLIQWIKTTFMAAFERLKPFIDEVIAFIKNVFGGFLDFIVGIFTGDLGRAWDGIKQIFSSFTGYLSSIFEKDWTTVFGSLGNIFNTFFGTIKTIWNSIKKIFSGIIDFITGVFSGNWSKAWGGIKKIFSGIWDGVVGILKGAVNLIIDLINSLTGLVAKGINGITSGINKVTGLVGIPAIPKLTIPKIPKLATGAVIPPNAEFMAILGDQKEGKNLEAPEDLIRQIVREETEALSNRPIYVRAEVSGRTLMNIIAEQEKDINRANGYTTGGGAFAY